MIKGLQIIELREKLQASNNETKKEQYKFKHCKAFLRRMQTDLHDLAGLIQEPNKLKTALKVSLKLKLL